MKLFKPLLSLSIAVGFGLYSLPAEALSFTFSGDTKKMTTFLNFRGDYDLPFGLNISGGLGVAPDLSSIVALPTSAPPASTSISQSLLDEANKAAKWDVLLDIDANLGYNFQLLSMDMGVGSLSATLVPYLGYRHMVTFTGAPNFAKLATGTPVQNALDNKTSQLQGINYGAKLKVGLPLGFSAFAEGGASTLFGGSISSSDKANTDFNGPITTNGATLPRFGLGAAWQFPFFDLASVYAGYTGFFLPSDLRLGKKLENGNTMLHSVNLGLRILWFGI